jgi:hypothetical protein
MRPARLHDIMGTSRFRDVPMTLLRGLALLVLLLLARFAAAATVHPPLEALRRSGAVVMRAEVSGIDATAATVELTAVEVLAGQGRERITLAVPRGLLADVAVGDRVIAAYDDRQKVARKPGVKVQTETGVLLSPEGLEPAWLKDTPEYAAWFRADHAAVEADSRWREQVTEGLGEADPALHNFHAAELALRPLWMREPTPTERTAALTLIRNADAHPAARARLLIAAAKLASAWDKDALLSAAREVLAHSPVQAGCADALANPDTAVYAALDTLELLGEPAAPELLERWLAHPSPHLIERVLLTLRGHDPDLERQALDRLAARQRLSPAVRQFLDDPRRRLPAPSLQPQETSTP